MNRTNATSTDLLGTELPIVQAPMAAAQASAIAVSNQTDATRIQR